MNRQVNTNLDVSLVAHLDRFAAEMSARSGERVSRSEALRRILRAAIMDGLLERLLNGAR